MFYLNPRFLLLLTCLAATVSAAPRPRPEDCFKVRSMRKATLVRDRVPGDEERYQVVASNTCNYTIDAIYVLVGFTDGNRRMLSGGLWTLYFMPSGKRWTKKFSIPTKAAGLEGVFLRKITTNAEEALHEPE